MKGRRKGDSRNRKVDRRRSDRRKFQAKNAEGWDGTERRKYNRRQRVRRKADITEDPTVTEEEIVQQGLDEYERIKKK